MHPLIEQHREAIFELCRKYEVRQLDVFGSAANGEFDEETSDLDFLVEFNRPGALAPDDQYFGLLLALEELFGRSIDLVTFKSIGNPYFRANVESTRQVLYAA